MNNVAESITNFSYGDDNEELCHIEGKLLKSINAQPGIRYRDLLRLFGLINVGGGWCSNISDINS